MIHAPFFPSLLLPPPSRYLGCSAADFNAASSASCDFRPALSCQYKIKNDAKRKKKATWQTTGEGDESFYFEIDT